MAGIIPSKGVTTRDAAGNCIDQTAAQNTYCPAPEFVMSCPLTALPSNCAARLDPAQVNALVSELLAFAEALCPQGEWHCTEVNNLARIWRDCVDLPEDPCASPIINFSKDAYHVVCQGGALSRMPLDICEYATDIVDCVISADPLNALVKGSDDLLFVPRETLTSLGIDAATGELAYTDELGNVTFVPLPDEGCCNTSLSYNGTTGVLSLEQSGGDTLTTTIPFTDFCQLADDAPDLGCLLSADANNSAQLGTDGKVFVAPSEDGCCITAHSLEFANCNTLRSTIVENDVAVHIAELVFPAQNTCVQPDRVFGLNAACQPQTFNMEAFRHYQINPAVGSASTDPGMSFALSQPVGTVFEGTPICMTVTNPSACLAMVGQMIGGLTLARNLIGNGGFRFSLQQSIDGGPYINYANGTYRTNGATKTFVEGATNMVARQGSQLSLLPGETRTMCFRGRVEITAPYAAGSLLNSIAINVTSMLGTTN